MRCILRNTILLICLTLTVSCEKENLDNPDNQATLKKLYKTYKGGEIDACKYNGETVYSAGLNAYDAGDVVFDKNGKRIGDCNYAWGNVDPICEQLTDCQVIYRGKDHISGLPPVDIYELGDLKVKFNNPL